MANPWERYQTTEAKPWEKYSAPSGDVLQNLGASSFDDQAVPDRTWGQTATDAAVSFIPSVGHMIGGVAESVTHPLDTAGNLGKLVVGAGERGVENIVGKFNPDLVAFNKQLNTPGEAEQIASAVGKFYGDRYGSMPGFKNAIATDPAGVMADAATLLTAGGAALTKAGMTRSGALASKASSMVDPLALTVKGIKGIGWIAGKVAAPVLGMTSGVGSEPIKQAYLAGQKGGATASLFKGNMRGDIPIDDVLNSAKQDLHNMNAAKNAEYRANMAALKTDNSVLSFNKINRTLADTANQYTFHGKVISEKAALKIKEVSDIINDWQRSDPNKFHTPEGMDKLKQAIGDVYSGIDPMKEKAASAAVGKIYNAVKDEITKQAPTYAKTMKSYSDSAEQIKEIEHALSIGSKASTDTAMRKLQSLMRNNVSTNYGQRLKLAQELEKTGGNQIMPALAGQALNDLAPRGLARIGGGLAAGGAFINRSTLAALPLASPRLVGEAAYMAGRTSSGINTLEDLLRRSKIDPRITANLLYQAQQPK